jgi:serine/threonine protein kinase/tetratricopeptide (TPR) repeat protein
MSDLTGKTLGRYRILERIGRGGMAEVYKGYQPSLDRYVAVKVLHPFLLEEEGSRARFEREARAVAALRHPNIVQVFDFDEQDGTYFMVMEYVAGPNLKAILQEQARQGTRLSLARSGEIVAGIGSALAYAHRQGMIHRDVKPHNIMFAAEGQPLLTDFGIAKIVGGENVSASGVLSGTPAYMSPEQGRALPLDARTDIYSLGVVLYEMVTGRIPFDADTPFAVVVRHINDPLPLPRTLDPQIPEAVERVILKAMAKAPEERFQTADEMVQATQAAVATGASTGAAPASKEAPLPPTQGASESSSGTRPVAVAPPDTPRTEWVAPASKEARPAEPLRIASPAPAEPVKVAPPAPAEPILPAPADLLPAAPPPGTKMAAARLGMGRMSCSMAVSVVAVLLLLIGGANYLGLGRQPSATAPPPGGTGAAGSAPTSYAVVAMPPDSEVAGSPLPTTLAAAAPPGGGGGGQTQATAAANRAQAAAQATAAAMQATTAVAADPSRALQTGDQALAAKQYDQALAVYNAVLSGDPQNAAALRGQGLALLGLGRYQDAINALTQALGARPDDPALLLARAQAGAGLQSWSDVAQDTERILSRDKASVPALLLHAQAAAMNGDDARAVVDLDAAVAAAPQDPTVYKARGDYYVNNRRPTAAVTDYQKALTFAPNDAGIWIALGRAYVTYDEAVQPQPDQALAAFSHALQVDPRNAQAYYWRARVYQDYKSDRADALADINQAITLGPPTADMYYLRATLAGQLANDKAQLLDLQRAVALEPKNTQTYIWLAEYYAGHQQYDLAAETLTRLIAVDNNYYYYGARSEIYLLLGEYARARADAQQAVTLRADAAYGYAQLAHIFAVQRDFTSALDQINQALDHAAADEKADLLAYRARINLGRTQLDQAAADLTAAAAINADNPNVLLEQAELAVARKQPAQALEYLSRWDGKDDRYGWGYVVRAGIEAGQNQPVKARADLQQARKLALFPDERQAAGEIAARLGTAP